ncbi:MAG: ATP-dependent RNA helicase [Deltaproteobacteria bacterium]|nr:ATP-dependent RNA helicase [Deltaproteobacteria bacterium]
MQNHPSPAALQAQAKLLPIAACEQELVETIRRNQVTVVVGPTGCGKTTQLPQMLLRAGLAEKAICVTQPRRIAAVSVAWRVAAELGVECGREVGYCIRFDDCSGPDTRLRIVTDGILLQEAHFDANWQRYSVIVIDEAHERTLNIDFALGLLHEALLARPDLRVVISSATLNPQKFVDFFSDVAGRVPVVEIPSRPHPVQIQYRPMVDSRTDAMVDAVVRETMAILRSREPGHVLVFLPGEDAIKRTAVALRSYGVDRDCAIMPLYGALRREDQESIFDEVGRRKIIIATNIAETSITIDGVRFVIDSGLAKVPRTVAQRGITILREEGISRASADQRAGRAGRTAPGICVRLYSPEDYQRRPAFTDEEILRLDLAETVLRLTDLGVKRIEDFAFPTAPPRSRILAAIEQLQLLGALDADRNLTGAGKLMAILPLTPSLGRMVVEAVEQHPNAADDAVWLAAWLSGRLAFVYPDQEEDRARRRHEQLGDPLGDAATGLRIIHEWLGAGDRRAYCARNYLDHDVLAFAENAHDQLVDTLTGLGKHVGTGGDREAVLYCMATGFAQNFLICCGKHYQGSSDDRIWLHPSSSLYGRTPRFVVAAEIVVSQRAYARQVSQIRGHWVATLRPDLADLWHLRPERLAKAEGQQAPAPTTLQLGPVAVAVEAAKGKPRVEIAVEQVPALVAAQPIELPKTVQRFAASVRVGTHVFAQGTPLGALLAILPLLPLPAPGQDLRCRVPEGALLDVHRNRHNLLRHLDLLLTPMLPHAGKRPGWVGLLCNGDEGYWYEILSDYREAVLATDAATALLAEQLGDDPEAAAVVSPAAERLDTAARAVRQAYSQGRS